MPPRVSLEYVLEVLRLYVSQNLPGEVPVGLRLDLQSGDKITHPIKFLPTQEKSDPAVTDDGPEPFVLSDFQLQILEALKGVALRADDLSDKVGTSLKKLYRHPGGMKELQAHGLVRNHNRCGYWRPDAPPPNIVEKEEK